MKNKIYKVIKKDIYAEECISSVEVKVFTNKELALEYLHQQIHHTKEDVKDLDEYCVEENETYYERYLNGYASQESVTIWLEEDFLDNEKSLEQKGNDYEIDTL